ncbi:MAG: class I SAM-dependent methyltransferase [Verrucomicrobiota bacterium]|nr:class I SAM-dependent methyltransferase [Verrucomicrobiota bacterium]
MNTGINLVKQVHSNLDKTITKGEACFDATTGNGYDTLKLAHLVGSTGEVFAIDIQSKAIESTKELLCENQLEESVHLFEGCHSKFDDFLPSAFRGKLATVVFNLGYLPGGEKSIKTQISTTLTAVIKAYEWLRLGGFMSVLAYRGHNGGHEEANSIEKLIESKGWKCKKTEGRQNSSISPILYWIKKT